MRAPGERVTGEAGGKRKGRVGRSRGMIRVVIGE